MAKGKKRTKRVKDTAAKKTRSRGGYDPDSEKASNFITIAQRRVNLACDKIRSIGNLSNRVNYDYTEDQVTEIMAALAEAVESVQTRFDNPGASREASFRFRG